MYIYESHRCGLYASDELLSPDDLWCETCGDSDTYFGEYESLEEAEKEYNKEYYQTINDMKESK